MDAQPDQSPATAERHFVRAKYLRTLARAASSTDVAVTLIRLAVHYERLARESQGQPAPRRKPQRS
jgi:hypothetical protein